MRKSTKILLLDTSRLPSTNLVKRIVIVKPRLWSTCTPTRPRQSLTRRREVPTHRDPFSGGERLELRLGCRPTLLWCTVLFFRRPHSDRSGPPLVNIIVLLVLRGTPSRGSGGPLRVEGPRGPQGLRRVPRGTPVGVGIPLSEASTWRRLRTPKVDHPGSW